MAPRAVASSSYHSTRALHILPPFDNLQLKKSVNGQRGGQSSRSANVFLPPAVVQVSADMQRERGRETQR